ncbi:amidohydrolase [Microbacterium sp. NPDC055903]
MPALPEIAPIVDELSQEFTALSDTVWDHPELRWEEHGAMAAHIERAEQHGARITREVGGVPTAFRAEWGGGAPVIAFLGEYDALDGVSQAAGVVERTPDPYSGTAAGHACGHNLLGAGSLLAATALARALSEHGLPGTVQYYGCPAEEAAAGKSFMVAGGAFDGVDAAVTWHPNDALSTSQVLTLAYTQAYFRFTGRASHAGAFPQHGRSALDAAELMNVGVNFLREHIEDAERIHYAFTDAGGTSPNVVQPTAELYYLVRSPTWPGAKALFDRVVKIAEGAAMMTETEVEVSIDGASAEIVPNRVLEEVLHRVVGELGGVPYTDEDRRLAAAFQDSLPAEAVQAARRKYGQAEGPLFEGVPELVDEDAWVQMTGSSDVGDVSWVVPTVQLQGGTAALGTPFHSWQLVAQGKSSLAHHGLVHAAKAMAATALRILTEPELLAAAATEHARRVGPAGFTSPIPSDLLPPSRRDGYVPA